MPRSFYPCLRRNAPTFLRLQNQFNSYQTKCIRKYRPGGMEGRPFGMRNGACKDFRQTGQSRTFEEQAEDGRKKRVPWTSVSGSTL